MSPRDRIAAWGFVPERLAFTLRTALAGCLALLVAWLLGLEHPQWAAMTVFSAAQPVRNLLVEKSFFRVANPLQEFGLGGMQLRPDPRHGLVSGPGEIEPLGAAVRFVRAPLDQPLVGEDVEQPHQRRAVDADEGGKLLLGDAATGGGQMHQRRPGSVGQAGLLEPRFHRPPPLAGE